MRSRSFGIFPLGIGIAVFLSSCEKSITEPKLAFELSTKTLTLFRGSTIRMEPGHPVEGGGPTGPFKWSSSDTAVVRVDATGLITGVSVGKTTVRALATEGYAESEVTVIEGGSTLRTSWMTTCGISRADNALYCWGRNAEGQVGIGNRVSPQPVPVKVNGGLTFTSISTGADYACGMTMSGPYCWGLFAAFIINDGVVPLDPYSPVKVARGDRFTKIEANGNFGYDFASACSDVVCGGNACALTTAADVFCWTATSFLPFSGATPFDPTPMAGVPPLRALSVGVKKACGITFDYSLYCWGNNYYLSLGIVSSGPPRQMVPDLRFQAVSAALADICEIDLSGDAYCSGANISGQLGAPSSESCRTRFLTTPCSSTPVKVLGGYKFLAISAGTSNGATTDSQPYSHTCGITIDLSIVCWGYNAYGQLGDGTTSDASTPRKVSTNLKFVSVTAGLAHTCAVTIDGVGYCWGDNSYGQLGNGTLNRSTTPVAINAGMTFR